jgi:hypothetical protein
VKVLDISIDILPLYSPDFNVTRFGNSPPNRLNFPKPVLKSGHLLHRTGIARHELRCEGEVGAQLFDEF